MPLVLDPASVPVEVLEGLRRSLIADLIETEEFVRDPPGPVRDPASIEAAAELVRSALARLELSDPGSPALLAADINLAYSAMVAGIDLVKSHTDVPLVPRSRAKS